MVDQSILSTIDGPVGEAINGAMGPPFSDTSIPFGESTGNIW